MRKFLNKKASFEISSQTLFWLPRTFFLIVFLLVVTTPIGCQSINKQNQLKIIEQREASLILNEIKVCLEKGISEQFLDNCLDNKNIGVKITSSDASFVLNPGKYEKELCNFSKKHICPKEETALIKVNDELKKVAIDLVMVLE